MGPTRARPLKLLLALLALLTTSTTPADAAFRVPARCRNDEVFDTAGVTCIPCPADASPTLDDLQAGYKTQCSCDGGRRTVYSEPAIEEPLDFGSCSSCPQGSVPSSSGDYCVACDTSQGETWKPARVNEEGTACECVSPTDDSVITNLGTGGALLTGASNSSFLQRCVICPPGTQPDSLSMRCSSCEYPKVWNGERCDCPDILPEGSRCSLAEDAWENIIDRGSVNFEMTFEDVKTASNEEVGRQVVVENSALLVDRLEAAASACFQTADRRACNELGNLCVLQMHDTDASACVLYQELVELRSDEVYHEDELGEVEWAFSLPWLFYPGDATRYLRATDVRTRMKFSGENTGGDSPTASVLKFKAARYALDGTFLGWRNFTHDLQLCGGQRKYTNTWAHFAVEYLNKCELPLSAILDAGAQQPEFIDLYFEDGPGLLYPVPSILENIPENNRLDGEIAFLELTRRFFTVDAVSGIEDGVGEAAVVRYLEKFSLEITLQDSNSRADTDGLIYPPTARIRYAARDPSISGVINTAEFSVHYRQGEERLEEFIDAWDYMIIAAMMGGVVVGFFKMGRFLKSTGSNGENGSELTFLFEFVAIAVDVSSGAIFAVLTAVSLYWLCFFKLQSSVYTILPLDEGEIWYRFRVSVICTVVGRMTAVLWMIWRQTSVDIFFIDRTKRNVRQKVEPPPKGSRKEEKKEEKQEENQEETVSCWRTLFVANQWNKLQTLRITNLEVTMLSAVFLLAGLDLENGAKINPGEGSLDPNPFEQSSQILRFGISVSIFTLIEIAQVLFVKVVVYWRMANPLVDFVDLLWLSNISMLVLDTCNSFYLHGELNGDADTNAVGLCVELNKPSTKRGFIEGDECQTFIAFFTKNFCSKYRDFLVSVRTHFQPMMDLSYVIKGPEKTGEARGLLEESKGVSDYFVKRLDEVRNDAKHVSEPSWMDKWLLLKPSEAETHDVFWKDRSMSFADVLFHGNEASLFMLQVMLFTSIDLRLRSAAFSGSITYLTMWLLNFIRQRWGKDNLSVKALIDRRFLL